MAAISLLDIKNFIGNGVHLQIMEQDEDGTFHLVMKRPDDQRTEEERHFFIDRAEAQALFDYLDYHLNFKA